MSIDRGDRQSFVLRVEINPIACIHAGSDLQQFTPGDHEPIGELSPACVAG
jgi:hypothetical protein